MNANLFYRIFLWTVAVALLLVLFACTANSHENGADTNVVRHTREHPMRLVLGSSYARDSAAAVTEFFVDQAIRAALDSIPESHYITINYRDSLAQLFVSQGNTGIPLSELGARLNADGAIFTRVARFHSVLAVELRIVEPASGKVLFRDLSFSMIRYRDTAGTMLLGPTLYDCVRKSLSRYFGVAHTPEHPVASEPLIISSVVIPPDAKLGLVREHRGQFSTTAVKAIGELARLNFAELVAFDYDSRAEFFRPAGVAMVEDFMPMTDAERRWMYNVGVDRFVTSSVARIGDSVRLRVELHYVSSRVADSLIDAQERAYPATAFQSTKAEEDFVIALIDQAEPLFKRESDRVRAAYEKSRPASK